MKYRMEPWTREAVGEKMSAWSQVKDHLGEKMVMTEQMYSRKTEGERVAEDDTQVSG